MLYFNYILNIIIKVLLSILLIIGIYSSIQFLNNRSEYNKIKFNKLKILRVTLYVLFIVFVIFLFKKYSILSMTLITFLASIVIAYILNPFVKFFERKNIKRIYSIIIVYFIITLFIFILAIGIIPSTFKQFRNLFNSFPDLVRNFVEYSNNINNTLFVDNAFINKLISGLNGQLLKVANLLVSDSINWLTGFVIRISNLIGIFIQLILIPVITFYLLLEKDKILSSICKKIPNKYEIFFSNLWKEIDQSLSMFVRGRIIMAIFVGFATMIYLMIFGIDFYFIIGVITCIADIIPYIGPFLGFIPAVFIALFKGPFTALWVAILFCLVQWIENNILGPKILGDSTGMHPLIVLILLIIGGGMFGVLGMIFSVPIAAVLRIVYKHTKPYIKKYLYKDKIES